MNLEGAPIPAAIGSDESCVRSVCPATPGSARWSAAWWLLAVTALSCALRLWIFNGIHGHDDWPYLFYIRSFFNGDTHELLSTPFGLRWGVWVPIAALFKIFGVHYWLAFVPGFVVGLFSIPIAYWITLRVSNDIRAARWASLALVFNPIDWFVSTTIRGDIEMSFYGGLIVLGLALLEFPRRDKAPRTVSLAIAIGIVWGIAAVTKEWAYVFAWGFLGLVLWRGFREKRIPWEYAYILLGFAAVLALDGLFLYLTTGSYHQRFSVSICVYDQARLGGAYQDDLSLSYTYLPSLLLNLSNTVSSAGRFVNGYPIFGWYFYLFAAAVVWGIVRRRHQGSRWPGLLCFILGIILWIEFGSMCIKTYFPYHKEPRYLAIVSVPIACAIGLAVRSWWLRLKPFGRMGLAILLGALAVSTAGVMKSEHVLYSGPRDFLPEFTEWLQAHRETRLWTVGTIQQEIDLRFEYRFSDPVHNHRGQSGYGLIQDLCFLDQAKPGDLILITPLGEIILGPKYTPEKWERIRGFKGPHSQATLYRM